ncbi:MAG: O-antigen ligase family protein [Candidatus Rokuibacteriota bacterium]
MSLSAGRVRLRDVRDWVLAAFFVALGVSISASQILLALLFLLVLPWTSAVRTAGAPGWLRSLGREMWADAEPLRRHPLTPPLVLLTALSLLSAALSGDPGWSLWMARDTLRIATFYLVLWYTRDAGHALRLWQGFLVVLTVMACYGLVQVWLCGSRPAIVPAAWLAEICTHASRVRGPFSIYMTFGGVLLLGALFFVAYLANVSWRRIWWMAPAGAITVAALAFTYSRNAWLGLAAGTLGLVATGRRAARVVLVLVGAVSLVVSVSAGAVMERVRSIGNPEDATVRDRVAMWKSGLAMIGDHPLLGVGPGQVRAWYQHYRRPEAVRPSTGHLHNSPIQIAAERGLPALAVWLWLWVVFFREGGRVMRRLGGDRPRERALVCASLGGVGGFLVAGLFEHNFGDGEVVMLVYALMTLPFIVSRDLPAPSPASPPVATR